MLGVAQSLKSSKRSDSDFVMGSIVSLCHLCLAVAYDSGLTDFRRNTSSKSSRVFLFDAPIFLNV